MCVGVRSVVSALPIMLMWKKATLLNAIQLNKNDDLFNVIRNSIIFLSLTYRCIEHAAQTLRIKPYTITTKFNSELSMQIKPSYAKK